MKTGISQIIGKRIKAVVIAESPRAPFTQVFIIFSDDTHFEFYGNDGAFSCAGGLDLGGLEKVRAYISNFPEPQITMEFVDL